MIDVVVDDTTCWLDTIVRGEDIRLPTNSRSVCEVQRSAFLTYVRNTLYVTRFSLGDVLESRGVGTHFYLFLGKPSTTLRSYCENVELDPTSRWQNSVK